MSKQIKTKAHASLNNDNKLCGAKTRNGEPCKNYAMANGRCRMHGGKSTGPKDKVKAAESQKKNKNAEKHGLFSKYLPEETNDIIEIINTMDRLDLLWENIKIQAAAIIRSQKIMYVKDREDKDKDITKVIEGDLSIDEFQVITAGERQANFLQSQSRAMTALSGMIKQYEELARVALKEETDKARLEQIKARTHQITGIAADIEDTKDLRELILNE